MLYIYDYPNFFCYRQRVHCMLHIPLTESERGTLTNHERELQTEGEMLLVGYYGAQTAAVSSCFLPFFLAQKCAVSIYGRRLRCGAKMCEMQSNLFSSFSILLIKAQRAASKIKRRKFMHRLDICWQIEINKQNKKGTLAIWINLLLAFLEQCTYPGGENFVPDRIKSVSNPTAGRDGFDPLFSCVHFKKKNNFSTPCKFPL